VFAESRKLAEEWTFRFFKAASEHDARPELDLFRRTVATTRT